jgi:hypothetical protein
LCSDVVEDENDVKDKYRELRRMILTIFEGFQKVAGMNQLD